MAQKKRESQDPIIDEVRKSRKAVWRDFMTDPKRFLEETKKLAKDLGMHYGTPLRRQKKDKDAA